MAGLYILVEKTRIGRAMRAVSENMETARLMGVNIERVIMFTFGIGGALAGAAGVINGLYKPQGVSFIMGFFPGVKAFTAAVLGGIGSVPGALIGGLLLGIFEALGPNLVLTGPGHSRLQSTQGRHRLPDAGPDPDFPAAGHHGRGHRGGEGLMQLLRQRLAKPLSQGALAGILCIYIALTGMMEAFGEREIVSGVLDLGKVVLIGPFAGLGLLLQQQAPNRRLGWMRVLAAGLAGIVATGLFILFIDAVSIRHMFTHASPALVAYMTMGQEAPAAGLGLFAVAALAAGAVGSGLALLPAYWRNTIFMAVLLVVGMALLSELISQVLRQILNGRPDRLLFNQGALRPAVAAITAAAVFAWRGLAPRIPAAGAGPPAPTRTGTSAAGVAGSARHRCSGAAGAALAGGQLPQRSAGQRRPLPADGPGA